MTTVYRSRSMCIQIRSGVGYEKGSDVSIAPLKAPVRSFVSLCVPRANLILLAQPTRLALAQVSLVEETCGRLRVGRCGPDCTGPSHGLAASITFASHDSRVGDTRASVTVSYTHLTL